MIYAKYQDHQVVILSVKSNFITFLIIINLLLIKPGWSAIGLPVEDQEGPLNISVSMIIEDINSINPLTMDFRLEFFLTHKWNLTNRHCQLIRQSIERDEKSENNGESIVLKGKDSISIWVPDTFIYNAKQVGSTTFDDGFKSLIVQLSGSNQCSFTYSLRLSALIPCPMNFRWYPVDKQTCRISIRSGSYSANQIRYSWLPMGVKVESKVPLLQHRLLMNYSLLNATVHDQALYTWLIVDLTFIRVISYHVLQIYLPTIILIIISYCSLWMGSRIIAGRITLGVTTQLALITQFSGLRSRLPQVSYINALDVWMIGCNLFVFSSILITTIIIVINQHDQVLGKKQKSTLNSTKLITRVENNWLTKVSSYGDNHQSCITNDTNCKLADKVYSRDSEHQPSFQSTRQSIDSGYGEIDYSTNDKISNQIDRTLRFIYPLIFVLFNALYWLTILI